MKNLIFVLTLVFSCPVIGQSLSSVPDNMSIFNTNSKKDSLHSSVILSVSYDSDTLYVKVRHYAVCCEKFVSYIEKKDNLSQINFVLKSLEKGCLCDVEKIVIYKVFVKEINRDVKLRINGKKPKYGIVSFSNLHGEIIEKKKRNKRKMKEM